MRLVNFFNLVIVMAAAVLTWQSVANAEQVKVHVMQNLSHPEAEDLNQALMKLGYEPSEKELFTESQNAIIVTKALRNEREPASVTVEFVQYDPSLGMPRILYQYRVGGNDVHAVLKAFPSPQAFNGDAFKPAVASYSQD